MKTKQGIAILLALSTAVTGHATLEFSAYTLIAKESKFVLTDTADQTSSGWIAIGQSFKGYALVSFDGNKEILSLKKGDATLELRLKDSRVKDASAGFQEVATKLAAAKIERAKLSTRYTGRHPRMIELTKTIAELEAQLTK